MSFFRDRDIDAFDATNDVTAPSRSPSASPRKKQRISHDGIDPGAVGTASDAATAKHDDGLESLRRRMAGPSSGKAGLAKDQDEINRIIYEASKGSKFFENERKKDQQTTERIKLLLARRDEKRRQVIPGSPEWLAIERRIEEMATKLENSRDLSRTILHCDMDQYYAAIELARDPSLKGKCFGVGSGVLVTASYEARRGYGVRSGMATFVAKALCPHLIVVKNDMARYVEVSQQVMAIFEEYDENLAKASLDEAYLDLTDYLEQDGCSVEDVVEHLRAQVKERTQLTVSVGIAPNTMLAKISSDRNKPDGQFRVMPDRKTVVDFMRDLACRKIPGIGRVNERILESLGVRTCGEIWEHRVDLWLALDGKIEWLLKAHLGLGNTIVEPSKREERKSVGREHTFSPTSSRSMLLGLLRESANKVEADLKRLDFRGKTVTLVAKKDTFQRFSRAKTVTRPVHKADDLYEITSSLLHQEIESQGALCLRLIGVRVTQLIDMRSAAAGSERFKKMFETSETRPRRGPTAVAGLDAMREEEEKQLALAIQQSLASANPFDEIGDLSQDAPGHPPDDQAPGEDVRGGAVTPTDGPISSGRPTAGDEGNGAAESDQPAAATPSHRVACPICGRPVEGNNDDLNRHIDLCLKGEATDGGSEAAAAVAAASTTQPRAPSSSSKQQQQKKKKGPLDGFFQRPR
ncbi:uncharacterized protein PFL1_03171 [Pseudozyma flocculosa PF-1]|uniref:DNA polymerase kappa n=2 Tax=Pseudozyma flocculosa TaxID=84751 RepID=A0A5C3F398_9BASI|nr:uncharacterized protein PFL1_03171 [Pseudozyma flocculosa PF-1]EPQ29416.1 hypothetical protein PFL1_03171 [Pseudozyma flocculosa PF-1]SPO37939.1 related to DNA polymerase kappa [Pseudozyma flocculosa]